jgi:hypothetical protein
VTPQTVLASRGAGVPGARWELRVSEDRGRLRLVLVVEPSASPVVMSNPPEDRRSCNLRPTIRAVNYVFKICEHFNVTILVCKRKAKCAGLGGHRRASSPGRRLRTIGS